MSLAVAQAPEPVPKAARQLLRIDGVSLVYPGRRGADVTALDHVSIHVDEGEFVVLVGPSGCGKSSLLYLTAGLQMPTRGDILLGQTPVRGPGSDRGMVFQSYTLFPWLTVRQNIEFGPSLKRMPAAERRAIAEQYIDAVGLGRFADHLPKQLSGGMKQRVAIARALANAPQILLMDEPFGALDSQTRATMHKLLLRVWESMHKTVLFVTHDIDEAILLADRVYVMSAHPGRIRDEIAVKLPRPRAVDMIMDADFIKLKRRILELIHVAEEI
jgi:NitT/TauT family transport system ATP-binding protein